MEMIIFLLSLGLIWTVFATVQDLRTREVANWLNFSLIAIALAVRLFYSIFMNDYRILLYGIVGFALFFALANIFYYGRIFAGGDAKLLMGYGLLLPYGSLAGVFIIGLGFVLLLFSVGAIYSLAYSLFLAMKNKKGFEKAWNGCFKQYKFILIFSIIAFFILILIKGDWRINISLGAFLVLVSLLYIYLKAVEKGCMVKLASPGGLTEGDWLDRDVIVGRRTIRANVHGLSAKDIAILKRAGKKVWIKEGIPFVPAFLIALTMVFFLVILEFDFLFWVQSLF